MDKGCTILLEVKSHIKSYLTALYGPSEPIQFPKRHLYNAFLIKKVGKPPAGVKIDFSRANKIEIQPPDTNLRDMIANNYLGERDQIEFRKIIERDFSLDFIMFIETKLHEGFTRKVSTLMFMNLYKISEDDISFSAFYRDYDRKKEKRRVIFSESDY